MRRRDPGWGHTENCDIWKIEKQHRDFIANEYNGVITERDDLRAKLARAKEALRETNGLLQAIRGTAKRRNAGCDFGRSNKPCCCRARRTGKAMMDRNTLRILRNRIRGRVFDGQPDVVRNGDAYHEALMNTGGVGLTCFPDASDQSAAFNAAWKQEAYAARAYIYALEKALLLRSK